MTDSTPRLPARPSLEQLRKQAKERLIILRGTDPSTRLAEAQHALAREYGFETWSRLVRHVEAVLASPRLATFDSLAGDFLAAYHGDDAALRRLTRHFGVSYGREQLRLRVRRRVEDATGGSDEPSLSDVRRLVARQYGFEGWVQLADALSRPAVAAQAAAPGRAAAPPFYMIDAESRTLEPRPPISDGDWDTLFAVMKEQGLTRLRTSAMTDGALEKLSRLDFITSVDLDGAQSLSDEGLLHLAGMPQLEELVLGGWHSPLTDRGLAVLRHLPRLERFAIPWARRVTDEGLAHLVACDRLERVDLMGTASGDGALAALRGKQCLRHLSTGRQVTDAGLGVLHDIPWLRRWHGAEPEYDLMTFAPEPSSLLLDGPITDRGVASLVGLDGLFGLGFFQHATAFTAEGLASLGALPNLGFLGCPGDRCDDAAMRSIAALPALRHLMAQGAVATDDGFLALSRSRTLEYLWGRECPNLHDGGFRALAALPALRGLGVSCKRVGDDALAALSDFPALTQLMPMDVSDAGFRHVGRCEGLVDLWCMYCRGTGDAATDHIAALRLRSYYAGRTRITDRSCRTLGRMTSLETVELWETAGVTNDGIAALGALPRLRKLVLSGLPRVTPTAVARIPEGVRVDYRS